MPWSTLSKRADILGKAAGDPSPLAGCAGLLRGEVTQRQVFWDHCLHGGPGHRESLGVGSPQLTAARTNHGPDHTLHLWKPGLHAPQRTELGVALALLPWSAGFRVLVRFAV